MAAYVSPSLASAFLVRSQFHVNSLASAFLVRSQFHVKTKGLRFSSAVLCNSADSLPRSYGALGGSYSSTSRRRFSRLVRVQATTLQEDEEKVEVEKSFNPKGFPEKGGQGTAGEPPEGSPPSSDLEKWIIKVEQSINIFLTDSVIKVLDAFYRDRDYARFFVLETIARVPYFAFMSVLHLYETFGLRRRADYLKVHFAESWNEMHHLLIMEELGGNSWWLDRYLAECTAFIYYFVTVFMYFLSPRMAYHFSECVERHAFETYDKFIKSRKDELMSLPAPGIAVKYYTGNDLYLFDEFQTSRPPNSRRPKIDNLYDVFLNIRDDEAEHCKTMKTCQSLGELRSPHSDDNAVGASGNQSVREPPT